ncbi:MULTISPECIES: hypothetical protein [Pontibacter]|nr:MULTISPECIES: hypothetical protein [Pontibacter]
MISSIAIVGVWFESESFELDRGYSLEGTGKPALLMGYNYN